MLPCFSSYASTRFFAHDSARNSTTSCVGSVISDFPISLRYFQAPSFTVLRKPFVAVFTTLVSADLNNVSATLLIGLRIVSSPIVSVSPVVRNTANPAAFAASSLTPASLSSIITFPASCQPEKINSAAPLPIVIALPSPVAAALLNPRALVTPPVKSPNPLIARANVI